MDKDIMSVYQDIGLDQDGYMEVLVERSTELPHEFTCRIKPNNLNKIILVEGNYVETKKNTILGQYLLENVKEGIFTLTLKMNENNEMIILIDDILLDKVTCTDKSEDVPVEEERRWLNARKDFIEYIESTLLFVQDPFTKKQLKLTEWEWIVEKLEWAKQIIDYEVTAEEYVGALQQIEQMINPVLQKTSYKKAFVKSPFEE